MRKMIQIRHHKIKGKKSRSFCTVKQIESDRDLRTLYVWATECDILKFDIIKDTVTGKYL